MVILKHLKRILIHKFWVAVYCFQIGLYWQGLTHDLSKFSWIEFSRSIKYWDNLRSPINREKEINGYSRAYLHHRGHNPHHYEYWVTRLDEGGVPVRIPERYAKELVCDYLAAGKVYSNSSFGEEYEWWLRYISTPRAIHSETREFITTCFRLVSEKQSLSILKNLHYGNYESYRRL